MNQPFGDTPIDKNHQGLALTYSGSPVQSRRAGSGSGEIRNFLRCLLDQGTEPYHNVWRAKWTRKLVELVELVEPVELVELGAGFKLLLVWCSNSTIRGRYFGENSTASSWSWPNITGHWWGMTRDQGDPGDPCSKQWILGFPSHRNTHHVTDAHFHFRISKCDI